MVRRLAPALGLMAMLAPATTLAQVNIDQDKSPAQLYAGDCAACHKSVRGLAKGRSASSLAGFLGEHYTASSREASAIAAYVLANGGSAAAAPARAKPEGERTRANAEELRNREARRPVQPEGKPPGNSAVRRPEPERRAAAEPGAPGAGRGPVAERHERGATRTRGRGKPVEAVSPQPVPPAPAPAPALAPTPAPAAEAKTAVAAPPPAQSAAPAPQASPASTAEPKAAAPAEPTGTAPVPRDNIPD